MKYKQIESKAHLKNTSRLSEVYTGMEEWLDIRNIMNMIFPISISMEKNIAISINSEKDFNKIQFHFDYKRDREKEEGSRAREQI